MAGPAFGFNGSVLLGFESTYGTAATDFVALEAMSIDPGVSQPRTDVATVGGGREAGKFVKGLITVAPSIEVPVDLDAIGYWLRLLMGTPVTTGTTDFTHVFKTGAQTLPSVTIEKGLGTLPDFRRLVGVRGGSMELNFRPGEVVQTMRIAGIGIAHARADTSIDNTPTVLPFSPITGPQAKIEREGMALGYVTEATLRMSNGLEEIRAANGTQGIKEAAAGLVTVDGSLGVRLAERVVPADAEGDASVDLVLGYSVSATRSLMFRVPGMLLEMSDYPIQGRNGIQASYNFVAQKSAGVGAKLAVTLKNQMASFS